MPLFCGAITSTKTEAGRIVTRSFPWCGTHPDQATADDAAISECRGQYPAMFQDASWMTALMEVPEAELRARMAEIEAEAKEAT